MYLHRTGYHPPNEQIATHQRRRYRLTRGPNIPNMPTFDPSLWIVHYLQAEPNNHFPANRIPINPQIQSMVTERRFLLQRGLQLVRKEFMLHDRNNWPTVNLPSDNYGQQAALGYPNNVISHMSMQQPSYLQQRMVNNQGPIGPPPTKRQRQAPPRAETDAAAREAILNREPTIYDEEDVSRGDLLDLLTSREISAMRYVQHHEWLEEVFQSPYGMHQIVPGELGLGRKGELEPLTKDFFDAPTSGTPRTALGILTPRVGRMEGDKAEEFKKKAAQKVAELDGEVERLRRQHSRRMNKLSRGAAVRDAEVSLRAGSISVTDPQFNVSNDDKGLNDAQRRLDEIQRGVEGVLGKGVRTVQDIECIQKGGLEEKGQTDGHLSQAFDMIDQTSDLSGQIPSFETPQAQLSSTNQTPGASGEQGATSGELATSGQAGLEAERIAMREITSPAGAMEADGGDWIMVDKNGSAKAPPTTDLPGLDDFTNDAAMGSNVGTPGEHLSQAAEGLADFAADVEGELGQEFDTNEFGEGVDFVNLDTAGEALSGYGQDDTLGLDEHGSLGLDDSAFGDAFHSNETGDGPG